MSTNDSGGSSKDSSKDSSNKQSLSDKYKKWDQIAKEADEDPECDNRDELDKFFKNIYKDLDDDGRKAMMKSFVESGGTVLSTNWKDVGQKKVDIKPPEGMEHKHMNSLADGICQQIEQLVDSSIHALKKESEGGVKTNGDELLQVWSANYNRLPVAFRDKLINDLQACIVDLESGFFDFGNYAVLIISMLQKCLPSDEIVQLIRCSFGKANLDNASYAKLLEFIFESFESKDNELKIKLTPLFLSSSNATVKFDRLTDNKIYILLVQIYLKILPPTNILHLQQVYPVLVDKLNEEVLTLKYYVSAENLQETRLVRASERILNIYLSAIYPLCNIRNSFLIMALSPNLIDLCLRKLPTTKRWFFQNFPIIHRNILAIAFTFAKTHEFFVATSSLNQTNKFVGESPSSLFFQQQINALSVLLSHSGLLASETMEFLIDWLFSLVSSFGNGIQMICDREELLPLRKTVLMLYFNDGISTTKLDNIADNLKVFDIMNGFNEEESKQFLEKFSISLRLKRSLENCHQLWKKIPALFVDKLFLRTNCNIKVNEQKLNQISLFDRVFQIKTFLFQHNKNAFDRRFSRSNIDQQFYSKPQWDIVLKLFTDDISQDTSFLPSITDIASLAIDEINKIRNETQPAQNSYHNTNNRQNPDRKERAHLRISCLLSLIEQLDRSLLERFHTTDLQKLDQQKFRVFSEMSLDMGSLLNLFNCAYKSGQYEFIILFSTHYFNQFEESTFNGELLVVVCWMVRAFIELKDGQSINGLKLWLEQAFGARLAWLDFAAMLADGQLENSLVGLDALSVEYLSNRDIVTETIFMLRERALRQILDPSLCHQLAPSFYSQFMRPIGAPPMFSTDLLNASVVLELSSWNQFDRLRTPVAPPNFEATNSYNLFNSIDQIESNLSSMQKIFANFGAQSVPDVLNCLHESEKQVLNLSREFSDFGMSSLTGARLFPIHIFVQLFRDIVFSTNAVDSTHLNELLLHNKKWSDFTRLEISQKIANWIEKFFGTTNPRFTELNPAFIKLSRRTGNLRLASSYLNKSPRGVLNQNILKNNFGELINLSEGLKLEILRNDPSNNIGLQQKFFAFADLTASHTDIFLASNSSKEQQAPEPIVKACLQLGNLVNFVPIKRELLMNKNPKSTFWTQLTSNLNTYQKICPGDRFENLLSGALLSMPRFLSTQLPKAHKHLSEWSLSQASTDVSLGVDAIRLMPGEEVALQALCGNLNEKTRESFLKLVGQSDNLDEFQSQVQNTPEFMNDANLLSGIESKSFEELWNALKARQQMFYGIAIESIVKFLENSTNTKPADQVSVALNLITLLVSHPNLFLQHESSNWIERTNVKVWAKIISPIFARLNHQDSFVRDTFKSLLEKIGNQYPHAICYPTFIRANQITKLNQNENEDEGPIKNNQSSFASEICVEILENLRSARPQLIADLELFIEEFQKIVLLTSEKWLFVLNHLEQGISRSCKQIEKESSQLLEIVSQDVQKDFVRQAKTAVFKNALDIVEDLYRLTCEGDGETTERERFIQNFKDLIQHTIKTAKENFEQPSPNFQEVFRNLTNRLSNSISMQSQYRIKLSNLSPKLSSCTNLSIPIPGQELIEIDDNIATIQSVDPFVYMLPTKTRPKKIKFIASDGKECSFLCKGQEDLHTDQMISNLFKMCNYMFDATKSARQDHFSSYNLSYYTVTPVSSRAGLIQWVQEPSSVYSLYRTWRTAKLNQYRQKRNALAEKSLNLDENPLVKSPERKNSEPVFDLELLSGHEERVDQIFDFMAQQQLSQNSAAELELSPKQEIKPKLLRHVPDKTMQNLKMSPIELFISVLKTKFSEKNLNFETMKNRKNWPSEVLLDTFNELLTMVPSTLIADELWLRSSNSVEWWQKVKQFGRSTAISSIVGALLAIGDRHLDNLLVDFSSGKICHVDFNVSFGKGQTLRVPECVPFRLTQNIVMALGPTKIEGNFRTSSEKTLEVLRANSPVVLSMLNTFANDPLIEWIPTSKQFSMGNLNIGISMIVYEQDRREHFASTTALHFLHLYLDAFSPHFTKLREELETSLMATCQLFTDMSTYSLNNGPDLHYFNDKRVAVGTRLKNAIVAHQNIMRPLKPLLRILTRADLRFSNFMKTYRMQFSNPLVNGHRLLANEKAVDYMTCAKNFQTTMVNAESIYAQLAELRNITTLSNDIETPMFMSAVSCEDVSSLAGSIFQETSIKSHNEIGGINEMGAEVVNKCRLFLKGVDNKKSDKPMSVAEHVDHLIKTATDKQNLSKLYEGIMPKKFTGENTKAVAARARKNEAKNEEKSRVEKAKEDAYWQDDDKNLAKKQQRKEDQERKKQETLAKAQEKNRLYEEEMNALSIKPTVSKPVKVTKAQIDAKKQKEQELKKQAEEELRLQALNIVKEDTLHENVNKLVIDGDTARTVDEALAVLGDEQSIDKHPEKRMRAAFTAFEERRLAELKIEKPTLRLSQLKQLLKKEWLKSPENPLNERLLGGGK